MQRDAAYLSRLRTYWQRHQVFPAMGKLTGIVGLSSTSSVLALVRRLRAVGYLRRVEGRIAPTRRFFGRPLPCRARVGTTGLAAQEAGVLSIDDYLVANPNRTALVIARDDSMKSAGLLDGDVVVVETNAATNAGDIVVAAVDGGLTVKTLRLGRTGFYLEPANPAYEPIRPQGTLEIVGVVVGSFRRHRR